MPPEKIVIVLVRGTIKIIMEDVKMVFTIVLVVVADVVIAEAISFW